MYLGSKNPLVLHQKYTVEFNCEFRLEKYPFELQRCNMTYQFIKTTSQEAVLTFEDVQYVGPSELVEYKVVNVTGGQPYDCGKLDQLKSFDFSFYKFAVFQAEQGCIPASRSW